MPGEYPNNRLLAEDEKFAEEEMLIMKYLARQPFLERPELIDDAREKGLLIDAQGQDFMTRSEKEEKLMGQTIDHVNETTEELLVCAPRNRDL